MRSLQDRRILTFYLTSAIALLSLIQPCLAGSSSIDQNISLHNGSPESHSTWTVEDAFKVAKISGIDISPDGSKAAYALSRAVMTPGKSEWQSQIYTANSDGTDARQFTQGDGSDSAPQWSPDGKRIAFISSRSGKPNVWALPANGGEAVMMTDVEVAVAGFKWSPDGKEISFTAVDPQTEEEMNASREMNDARIVGRDVYANGEDIERLHLWVVSAEEDSSGQVRRLTTGNFCIATWCWSPDCRTIAFSHMPVPGSMIKSRADISRVDVENASIEPLVCFEGAECGPVLYSPDGRWIAYGMVHPFNLMDVLIMPADGGESRTISKEQDLGLLLEIGIIGWSQDGKRLYVPGSRGTSVAITALPVDGSEPEDVFNFGYISAAKMNCRGDMVGLVMENSSTPPEAYISEIESFRPVRITYLNWNLSLSGIGETEAVQWNSSDGRRIEGLLTYPAGYEPGKRYPLLVESHGGPSAGFLQFFTGGMSWPIIPAGALSSKGYLLLRPNVRGSTGYGPEFTRANFKDWGGMDFQDILSGVDYLIDAGIADPDRLGIVGQSYGGYMADWAVTQTDMFKAAVMIDGESNLISLDGTHDIPLDLPDSFGCNFWDDYGLYESRSPIYHIKNVTTPMLILHGALDVRVPTSQAEEIYSALKKRGVPVEMVIYPRSGHFPGEPKLLLDMYDREIAWFDKYLRGN